MSATQARLGLAIGGAVIGGFFGVPGLGLAVGSIAGTLLFPGPDPPPALGPRLGDLNVQVSAYGNPIPLIFGTERVAGNIIWNSDIHERAHKNSSGSGGKGGSPQQESVTFSYDVDMAIALCVGPIIGIKRVWADDQLYYDFENPPHAKGIGAKIYFGSDDQLPSTLQEADKGVGNVPAYRGLAYIEFTRLQLDAFGNHIPTLHFEVIADGVPLNTVTEVLDDPENGGPGRIQIDPDTGFIWAARLLTDRIVVFNCNNGLNKICEISTQEAPLMLSYQPAFTAVNVDILGTVSTQLVQPRMFVGSHAPDAQEGSGLFGYATDGSCRVLTDIPAPMNDSNFCWPGMVHVDLDSINLQAANFGDGPTMINGVTNGACSFIVGFPLSPFSTGGGLGTPTSDNPAVLGKVEHTADIIQGNGVFYAIDWDGRLWEGRSTTNGGFTINKVIQATASFANLQNSVAFDPEEEMIYTKSNIFGANTWIKKWDTSFNLIWQFETTIAGDNNYDPRRIRYHEGVGDILVAGKGSLENITVRTIDKQSGGYKSSFEITSTRTIEDFRPFPGAPFAVGTFSSFPGGVMKFPLAQAGSSVSPTLASVVTRLVEKGVLTAADIDVTSITTPTVRGFKIAQRMPIRNAIQILLTAYFVDVTESDYKLKFVLRGTSPVVTVPPSDMAAHRDGAPVPSVLEDQRTQENELPKQLDVRFINFSTDYKIGVTTTRRLIGDSEQLRTLDLAIVFTPDEAKAINDVIMHNTWFERTSKAFTLGRKYLRLDPTDVITITSPDQGQINVRLNSISFSMPQMMQIQAAEDDSTVYSGFEFPAPVPLQPQPGLIDTPPVVLIIMDIPTLRDVDNNTGVYVVSYALGGPFGFSQVFHSTDGVSFAPVAGISNEGAVGFADERLTWEGSFN
jgi:hypothetical protein